MTADLTAKEVIELALMNTFCLSSRRRHTRWPRDWSSDVCSSDLGTRGRSRERGGCRAQTTAPGGATMSPMAADAHSSGDVIRLVGLGGIGRHGVLPEERRDGQQFLVDLDIHVDTTAAAAHDDLSRTVDYAAVAGEVNAIIEGEPLNLIETLAARIADAVLNHGGVRAVGVTVHKPEAPLGLPFTDVQVQIHRTAPSQGRAAAPRPEQTAAPQGAQQVDADHAGAAMLAPAVVADQVAGAGADEGVPALSPSSPDEQDVDVLEREPDGEVAAVLGLGGNVGDVRSTLRAVVEDLRNAPGLKVQAVSPLARTAAVVEQDAPAQPDYLNAVVLVTTTLSPMGLLNLTRSLEDSYGRERTERWGQRTVDIDIIDYDGVTSTEEVLSLPHPRANERAFVLVPWAQVDPDAFLPGLGGGPVAMLAETAPDRGGVRWLALDWLERAGHGTDSGSFVVSHDVPPAPVAQPDMAEEQGQAPPAVPPASASEAPGQPAALSPEGGAAAPDQSGPVEPPESAPVSPDSEHPGHDPMAPPSRDHDPMVQPTPAHGQAEFQPAEAVDAAPPEQAQPAVPPVQAQPAVPPPPAISHQPAAAPPPAPAPTGTGPVPAGGPEPAAAPPSPAEPAGPPSPTPLSPADPASSASVPHAPERAGEGPAVTPMEQHRVEQTPPWAPPPAQEDAPRAENRDELGPTPSQDETGQDATSRDAGSADAPSGSPDIAAGSPSSGGGSRCRAATTRRPDPLDATPPLANAPRRLPGGRRGQHHWPASVGFPRQQPRPHPLDPDRADPGALSGGGAAGLADPPFRGQGRVAQPRRRGAHAGPGAGDRCHRSAPSGLLHRSVSIGPAPTGGARPANSGMVGRRRDRKSGG